MQSLDSKEADVPQVDRGGARATARKTLERELEERTQRRRRQRSRIEGLGGAAEQPVRAHGARVAMRADRPRRRHSRCLKELETREANLARREADLLDAQTRLQAARPRAAPTSSRPGGARGPRRARSRRSSRRKRRSTAARLRPRARNATTTSSRACADELKKREDDVALPRAVLRRAPRADREPRGPARPSRGGDRRACREQRAARRRVCACASPAPTPTWSCVSTSSSQRLAEIEGREAAARAPREQDLAGYVATVQQRFTAA